MERRTEKSVGLGFESSWGPPMNFPAFRARAVWGNLWTTELKICLFFNLLIAVIDRNMDKGSITGWLISL